MVSPLVEELEQAFQAVRDLDLPLGKRLEHIATRVRELSPMFADAVDGFVGRLERAGAGGGAPQVGDLMPGFVLPDQDGKLVNLDCLLERAPVAIAFHRGHWCPYCRLNAVGLAEVQERLKPVEIVAISAETEEFTRAIRDEAGARFPFLTDFGNGYALSLGLAVFVDPAMSSLIASAGWDVPAYQGDTGWILPIPSVFVVGQDGRIVARHVDPDYRRRFELDRLEDAVASLRLAAAPTIGPAWEGQDEFARHLGAVR